MSNMIYRYWGKARPRDGDTASCHLLAYHSLDVAAVGVEFLRRASGISRLFFDQLSCGEDEWYSWAALWLARLPPAARGRRRAVLGLSLCTNLGLLAFFKYASFFLQVMRDVLGPALTSPLPPELALALPMGISFNGHAGAIDWIQSRFKKSKPATLYVDEIRTPTYTDCLNRLCELVLAGNLRGLYHAGGPRPLSLFQIAQIINRVGGYAPQHLLGCPRMEAGPMPPRAGNVAMDAARWSRRLTGVEEVYIIYRRSEDEMPARTEEKERAKEEGVIFKLLTNPVAVIENEQGWVKSIQCIKMQLGEPDESGRSNYHDQFVGVDDSIDLFDGEVEK